MKSNPTSSKGDQATGKVEDAARTAVDKTAEAATKVGHELKHFATRVTHRLAEKVQEEKIRLSAIVAIASSKIKHSRKEKEEKRVDATDEVEEKAQHDAEAKERRAE